LRLADVEDKNFFAFSSVLHLAMTAPHVNATHKDKFHRYKIMCHF